MLYLGIDQHARQITISLRDDSGDVLQARQVSTQPEKINAFFQQLTREGLHDGQSFVAVLEVCGFNDWLIRMLQDYRCHQVYRRRRRIGEYNTVLWRIRQAETSSNASTWP